MTTRSENPEEYDARLLRQAEDPEAAAFDHLAGGVDYLISQLPDGYAWDGVHVVRTSPDLPADIWIPSVSDGVPTGRTVKVSTYPEGHWHHQWPSENGKVVCPIPHATWKAAVAASDTCQQVDDQPWYYYSIDRCGRTSIETREEFEARMLRQAEEAEAGAYDHLTAGASTI